LLRLASVFLSPRTTGRPSYPPTCTKKATCPRPDFFFPPLYKSLNTLPIISIIDLRFIMNIEFCIRDVFAVPLDMAWRISARTNMLVKTTPRGKTAKHEQFYAVQVSDNAPLNSEH
jgi:hypothetical protein